MAAPTVTCPRCFSAIPAGAGAARFCPHCGLPDAAAAATDTAPLDVTVGRRHYRVLDRIAIGSVCTLYRCRFPGPDGREVEGVFKVARDARVNDLVANEASVLRRLHAADAARRFAPFLPEVVESFGFGEAGDDGSPPRRANVLRMHAGIASPDELYTLDEVRGHHAAGLDPRHVAWIWRRVLSVLGFAHTHDVVHGAVLPMHVLVEPLEHKLVLVDWCCAAAPWQQNTRPPAIVPGGHLAWYKREAASRQPPTPHVDVALAARSMIYLLGGGPVNAEFPPTVDPALQRHFSRCLTGGSGAMTDAWRLLDDFDGLIDALWGERRFCVLDMPPRATAAARGGR